MEERKESRLSKMIHCKVCGAEIAPSAKTCPSCGASNKPPVYKRIWFWLLMIFVLLPILTGILSSGGTTSPQGSGNSSGTAENSSNPTASAKQSEFDGDCGVSASAQMGASIIGYPELTISITNTSEKDISAIQFYAVPYDVYGDEITSWKNQNNLYTDTAIGAGKSTSISYQFIEDRVKTVKLYIYSVYFSDGTEWGNKDAAKSTILDHGALVEVSGES